MADVNVPYIEPGLAAFEELDNYATNLLISGSWPSLSPGYPLKVKADEELSQFEVVGLDSNGDLVPATWNSTPGNAIQPIGVVTQAVTGASDGSTTVPVFYAGCFNPAALVWDSSFDTDAKKRDAFVGAPSPTQILIRERQS